MKGVASNVTKRRAGATRENNKDLRQVPLLGFVVKNAVWEKFTLLNSLKILIRVPAGIGAGDGDICQFVIDCCRIRY